MKPKQFLTVVALTLASLAINAQDLIISKNGELNKLSTSKNNLQKLSSQKIENNTFDTNESYYIDHTAYRTTHIDSQLKTTPGYIFYGGLQSPYNSNIWIYREKEEVGGNFKIIEYDKSTGIKIVLLEEKNNADCKTLSYTPIAWSNDSNVIYMEAQYIYSTRRHEGVWKLDINNKQLTKLSGLLNYLSTPFLSPDRTKFYATGNVDNTTDLLHGENNKLIEFDLRTGISKTLITSVGDNLVINGFEGEMSNDISKATSFSDLDYFLPWDTGKPARHVVVRHGNPGPVGEHTNDGLCNNCPGINTSSAHDGAAIDFAPDVLSQSQNVRAAQAGKVVFAKLEGSLTTSFGNLVIILHSDGTETFYAHNSSFKVKLNDMVTQGQVIAIIGSTGNSSGPHIHFEWQVGGVKKKGNFTGIGEPRAKFFYVSNNVVPSGGSITPVITAPTAGQALPSGRAVNFAWRTSVVGTPSCRIQVSKVNAGWTAANGFTSNETPSGNVVVNRSASNLLSYAWTAGSAGSSQGPLAGTTYWVTVKAFSNASGPSQYSPARKFSINSATARESIIANQDELKIFPNPSNGEISLNFNSNSNTAELNIFDLSGVEVFSKKYQTQKGDNVLTEKIQDLKSGNYIVIINNGDKILSQNIIIQNK